MAIAGNAAFRGIALVWLAIAAAGATPAGAQAPEPVESADPALDELEALSRRPDDALGDIDSGSRREPVSVTLRALNKTTARFTDIEAPMNAVVRFGTLEITPRFCDKRPPEEFPETTAFLQIADLRAAANYERGGKAAADAVDGGSGEVVSDAQTQAQTDAAAMPADASAGKAIFSGWMFASSPALNALEHPVYDVWVIDCKTVAVDS